MALPTQFLPPLKKLSGLSAASLSLAHSQLKQLYRPKWVSRMCPTSFDQHHIVDSGYASGDDEFLDDSDSASNPSHQETWEIQARSDPLEWEFAVRWMTGFIARSADWLSSTPTSISNDDAELEDREAVIDSITSLLGAFARTSESGDLTREFVFGAVVGQKDNTSGIERIAVTLKDADLIDDDHTSVGLQTWGSCVVMMERLCLNPSAYGLSESSELKRPLRILELGAGTGLLSLAIGSLCIRANIPAHIIATDYHPDVLHNLRENLTANPCSVSDSVTINVEPLDWKLFSDRRDALDGGDGGSNPRSGDMTQTLDGLLSPIFSHPFDIIMASDVVYRPKHAEWLSCTVKSLLRRHDLPDIASDCDVTSRPPPPASFHLMAAIRPTHEHTRSSIEKAFNIHEESFKTNVDSPTLRIVSFQDIAIKAKPVGRADEIGYREYRIEWR